MEPASPEAASPAEPFATRTPWTAGAAAVFGLLTLALSIGTAGMMQPLHAGVGRWLAGSQPGVAVLANAMLTLLIMQAVIFAMVWWGAARFGGQRLVLLSLRPNLPLSAFLYGLAGMVVLLGPYNLTVYLLSPENFAADLRPFWELARSQTVWLSALAIVIGAPITEELLFRGFLLPALTKTRWGFAGAALLTTLGWTALHFYSLAGLIEVFLIGLYFSWLMHRHANLWLPIALHMLYNGGQLAVMALWPA